MASASYRALNYSPYSARPLHRTTHHGNQILTYLALPRNTELFENQLKDHERIQN